MADFSGVAKAYGSKKWKKRVFVIIILIILACLFYKRDLIIEKVTTIKENIALRMNKPDDNELLKPDETTAVESEENEMQVNALAINAVEEDVLAFELITIDSIDADSFLTSKKGITYPPENMIDGDLLTSWQEGMEDYGQGCKLVLSCSRTPRYIVIHNGNQRDAKSFEQNNRLKDVLITINNQTVPIELKDTMNAQIFEISGEITISRMEIEIQSVYEGSKYNDTCIAEFECY